MHDKSEDRPAAAGARSGCLRLRFLSGAHGGLLAVVAGVAMSICAGCRVLAPANADNRGPLRSVVVVADSAPGSSAASLVAAFNAAGVPAVLGNTHPSTTGSTSGGPREGWRVVLHMKPDPASYARISAVPRDRCIRLESAPIPALPELDIPLAARNVAGANMAGTALIEDWFRIIRPFPGEVLALARPASVPPAPRTLSVRLAPVVVTGIRDVALRDWLRRLGALVPGATVSAPWMRPENAPSVLVIRPLPELGLPIMQRPQFLKAIHAVRTGKVRAVLLRMPGRWNAGFLAPALYTLVRGAAELRENPDVFLAQYGFRFGGGAVQVCAYFRFWEDLEQKRGVFDPARLRRAGWGDPVRGLYRRLQDVFDDGDFVKAVRFLHDAQVRTVDPAARRRLEKLLLLHEHARLTAAAVVARNRADRSVEAMSRSLKASRRLRAFREAFRRDLDLPLDAVGRREDAADDAAGLRWSMLFRDAEPLAPLAGGWRWKADPGGKGRVENWAAGMWPRYRDWTPVRVDEPWEVQNLPVEKGKTAGRYDGLAWYACGIDPDPRWNERSVFLDLCVAPGNRAVVYVNGVKCGEGGAETKAAVFRVRIDKALRRRGTLHEVVVVRFENRRGPGGFVRVPWLSAGTSSSASAGTSSP